MSARARRTTRWLLAPCLLALAAATFAAQPPPADLRWPGGVFHWRYSRFGEPAWLERGVGEAVFRSAAQAWEGCGVRIEFDGATDERPATADGVNTVAWSKALKPGLRGNTLRRRNGSLLVEADVLISATNLVLRTSPQLLRRVASHEFGHALGLVHSADCADVMSLGSACPGNGPQRPSAGDLVQCALRYASPASG